ncbi:MAG: hypothetical protein KIT02_00595 [Devosia sp.]|uniref:DUF6498-containing protein n=1 Tax=Devosia sp. TaxID=1871048 RepID=UPI0024C7F517|nr:DUF6498-containing protein [Devosia sp.]UYN99778.1 MAG: hypothetical protein KIT02_00595 [Devosia sp.]
MHFGPYNTLVLTVLSAILPLFGVLFAGWDIFTLMVFYWCETLVIAFWTVLTIAFHIGEAPVVRDRRTGMPIKSGISAGFIALHASVFMGVHLFLMSALYGDGWSDRIWSVEGFVRTMVIGENLWPILLLIFLYRGAVFLEDRRQASLVPTVAALYVRIVVMQFVIIFGGWGVMLTGSGMIGLLLLIGLRLAIELSWGRVLDFAIRAAARPTMSE